MLSGSINFVRIALIALASIHASVSVAQEPNVGTLDHEKIIAGQTFHLKMHFANAPSYSSYAMTYFDFNTLKSGRPPQAPVTIVCRGETQAGKSDVDISCPVPFDAEGGIYTAGTLRVAPPLGGSRERNPKVSLPDIEILPIPDTNVYPQSASATILLSQRQILQDGAAKIEVLLDHLNTRVDNNSAETPSLKAYLATIAKAGQGELEKTREAYRQTLPDRSVEPIFFEDFSRLYAIFLIEAHAPPETHAEQGSSSLVRLMKAQLQSNEEVTVHPSPFSSSLGPLVSKLAELLGNQRAAFQLMGDSGSTTFTISLRSTPPGATVSYKRVGEKYQDYSKATDIDQATFPYALWTFRFTLAACEVVKSPNPYIEKSPNLNPIMQNCRRK